jgi:hypothetical protein
MELFEDSHVSAFVAVNPFAPHVKLPRCSLLNPNHDFLVLLQSAWRACFSAIEAHLVCSRVPAIFSPEPLRLISPSVRRLWGCRLLRLPYRCSCTYPSSRRRLHDPPPYATLSRKASTAQSHPPKPAYTKELSCPKLRSLTL